MASRLLVERLLTECPQLTVLATSRARPMVPFEWVFPVPPLSLPDDEGKSDAVALFTERSVAAGWPVDTADRDRVIEVCRALDGVALAIELAVARLRFSGSTVCTLECPPASAARWRSSRARPH